jgi:uncharacterized membrane protein
MTLTPLRTRAPGARSDVPDTPTPRPADRLAKALGWASLGLGLPQLLAPGRVADAVGVGSGPKQRALATAVGARELVHAAGLLHPRTRSAWTWTRVAGDAMDLAALGVALKNHDGRGRGRTLAATGAVAGIAGLDLYAAVRSRRGGDASVELTGTTTVRKEPGQVYAFWRRLDNLATFMAHVDDVTTSSAQRSAWTVSAPFGRTVQWEAEIVEDVPGERLAWRSLPGADVSNEGSVELVPAPGDRGTEVRVTIRYSAPGGRLGRAVARFAGEEPHQQLDDDLRRFKQVMETGEVVRSEGAPLGKRARKEFPQHPAQPLSRKDLDEMGAQA